MPVKNLGNVDKVDPVFTKIDLAFCFVPFKIHASIVQSRHQITNRIYFGVGT
jgi:hypothetical protein